MERIVYLDHNATTPMDPSATAAMAPYLGERYGNPSSVHRVGRLAREAVEEARGRVAALLAGQPEEVIFTSGGTEANNLAIKGIVWAQGHGRRGCHLITTQIEHQSVLEPCRFLERAGVASVTYLPVDRDGLVDPADLEEALRPETVLISVMHANNEIGTIQPIEEVAAIARRRGVPLHVDAVQTAGKVALEVGRLGADLVSVSAHKCYGPKGVGALWVRRGVRLAAQQHGGHHERSVRGGTEPVAAIVGFGAAATLAADRLVERAAHVQAMAQRLWCGLRERVDGIHLNGHATQRLPGTLNIAFEGVDGEVLLIQADLAGICLSLGAACDTGSVEPSHVLLAMGVPEPLARASLRLSLGTGTTPEEIDYCLETLPRLVGRLRAKRPHRPQMPVTSGQRSEDR